MEKARTASNGKIQFRNTLENLIEFHKANKVD
jgi:hypothetical protein